MRGRRPTSTTYTSWGTLGVLSDVAETLLKLGNSSEMGQPPISLLRIRTLETPTEPDTEHKRPFKQRAAEAALVGRDNRSDLHSHRSNRRQP